MNEIDLYRMQENEAFGAWLIEAIGEPMGITGPDAAQRIDRAVYKGTQCGAWVRFDEKGIMVGAIIEGTDAELAERVNLEGINPQVEGVEEELNRRFWAAVNNVENAANEIWDEYQEKLEYDD
jgi:hypothetical protein